MFSLTKPERPEDRLTLPMRLLLWLLWPISVIRAWQPPESALLYGTFGVSGVVSAFIIVSRLERFAEDFSFVSRDLTIRGYVHATYFLALLVLGGGIAGGTCLGRALDLLLDRRPRRG